ncbi:MAG TPA: LysR family transcriptional regulator [Thioalkalivibrio sp.]|nr:LysR family transcriptional regulator [Thioalkalivibrio sp.]
MPHRNAQPRLRVLLGSAITMGPGKADLLEAIEATGSISAAARAMGMSYRRAWQLVNTMNQSFRKPVVDTATGGSGGGGARVTDFGRDVLTRYRHMETIAAQAVDAELREFLRLLSPPSKS